MSLFAPAKINLTLHVTGRREDGYHTLHSLMAFTDIGDEITLQDADSFGFAVDGPFAAHAPAGADNLAVRAVRAMEDAACRVAHIGVRLRKNIPAGAGLGGGSADAACVMRALNERWGHVFGEDDLRAIGLRLGAELPVCLAGSPHIVSGIGDVLTQTTCPRYHAVVIWPGVKLATADVFRAYGGPYTPVAQAGVDVHAARNDLTAAAITLAPVVGDALAALSHCVFARMTGSGSSVFGICASEADAKETAAKVAAAHPGWWVKPCRINP